MFYKTSEVKKEMKKKIDIILNGKNAKEIITNVIRYSDVTLVIADEESQEEFKKEYESHKAKNGRIKNSVFEMESKSVDLSEYVLVHKKEYEKIQAFNKKKILSDEQIKEIKIKSEYKSQRAISKEYGISVATVNKVINDKY
ncbi:MAG: hypothetical protein ACRCX7_14770 [Cetobacterium sp.]|uniref:hypothetical protein n=1 Tax=Cetobacterium sp. TaxID=2071632 RepID=UPI003F2B5518